MKAMRKSIAIHTAKGVKGRHRLKVRKKLLFATIAIVGFFGLLEVVLTVVGVEPAYLIEDPLVGFGSNLPLFLTQPAESGGQMVRLASAQSKRFNPIEFRASVPERARRMICLGGSTTYGRPFFDDSSFAGFLRVFLSEAAPSEQWEVINAGAFGYASYRVARVMQELVEFKPDVIVIYTGHNEFLERRTYANLLGRPPWSRRMLELLLRTRTAGVALTTVKAIRQTEQSEVSRPPISLADEVKAIPVGSVGPEAYHRDDPWHQGVINHFERTLRRMVRMGRQAGALVILVTPSSNIAGFSPFKSEHRSNITEGERVQWQRYYQKALKLSETGEYEDALEMFAAAEQIDPRYADLHYAKGKTLQAMGQTERARATFIRARDEDICPLRATSDAIEAVRRVAHEESAVLVDFARYLRELSGRGPGAEYFYDHVHLRMNATSLLAEKIMDALSEADVVELSTAWDSDAPTIASEQVIRGINRERHATELRKLASMLNWLGESELEHECVTEMLELSEESGPSLLFAGRTAFRQNRLERAIDLLRRATTRMPDDAEAHAYLGLALAQAKKTDSAIDNLQRATELDPNMPKVRTRLGILLALQGELNHARQHLVQAVVLEPTSYDAHNNLGLLYAKLGDYTLAEKHYRESIRLDPKVASPHYNMALLFEDRGLVHEATRHYRRALELRPDHVQANRRLRELTTR